MLKPLILAHRLDVADMVLRDVNHPEFFPYPAFDAIEVAQLILPQNEFSRLLLSRLLDIVECL